MYGKFRSRKQKYPDGLRAQAIVEFAIALPVLMMLLVGIMEVGRMVFMYASVVNSSRDAVRYASAYGRSDNELGNGNQLKYSYCYGIRDIAKKSGSFLKLQNTDIAITYDSGPGTASLGTCNLFASPWEDPDIVNTVDTGDRVTVTVSATYNPMVSLLPLGTRTFTATSSRTILGVLDLDN
jgi:Flp pilus assembly protein TadG